LILIFVGTGIYLAGVYGGNERQKRAGTKVMRVGFILFVIFGAFFEMLFSIDHSLGVRGLVFPILMLLLGGYLIIMRLNLFGGRKPEENDPSKPSEPPLSPQ
jgi:ABC-type branched-subunit amino acid transport system permease subunit